MCEEKKKTESERAGAVDVQEDRQPKVDLLNWSGAARPTAALQEA